MPCTRKGLVRALVALLTIGFVRQAGAQTSTGAVYVATYVDIQPASVTRGIALLKQYRQAGRTESGNLALELFQETGRSSRFVLIESWKDQASFDEHEKADRTTQFRNNLKAIHRSPYDQRVNHGLAIDARLTAKDRGVVFVVTHVDVPGTRQAEAEVLLRQLAENSQNDAGSVRFDVYQQNAPRPNHFTMFAAWNDEKALDAHEMNSHSLQFREALAPMLGALYDDRIYRPVN